MFKPGYGRRHHSSPLQPRRRIDRLSIPAQLEIQRGLPLSQQLRQLVDCRRGQYRRGLGQQLFHQLFRGREFRLDQLDLICQRLTGGGI